MNLIQQHWKSQSEFVRVIELTKNEISKWKQNIIFRSDSHSDAISKDVIVNTSLIRTPGHERPASEFQKLLLSGPEMTEVQFNYIQEKRKHLNEWK